MSRVAFECAVTASEQCCDSARPRAMGGDGRQGVPPGLHHPRRRAQERYDPPTLARRSPLIACRFQFRRAKCGGCARLTGAPPTERPSWPPPPSTARCSPNRRPLASPRGSSSPAADLGAGCPSRTCSAAWCSSPRALKTRGSSMRLVFLFMCVYSRRLRRERVRDKRFSRLIAQKWRITYQPMNFQTKYLSSLIVLPYIAFLGIARYVLHVLYLKIDFISIGKFLFT